MLHLTLYWAHLVAIMANYFCLAIISVVHFFMISLGTVIDDLSLFNGAVNSTLKKDPQVALGQAFFISLIANPAFLE